MRNLRGWSLPQVATPHRRRRQQILWAEQHAACDIAVTAQEFRGAVHDQIRPQGQWLLIDWGRKSVIDHDARVVSMRDRRNATDIEYRQRRIGWRLKEHKAHALSQHVLQSLQFVSQEEMGNKTQLRQLIG